MIYLIGGAPRCGKTILAKKLSKKKRIPLLMTDVLRPIVLSYIKRSERVAKMPFEKGGSETMTAKESLNAELKEAKTMQHGVLALVKQLALCQQDYIIEGVHLLPSIVDKLRKESFWKHIRVVYLIKKDKQVIIDGFKKNTDEYDWMAGCLRDKIMLSKMADMVLLKSTYIEQQAKKYELRVIDTSKNFK